MKYFRVWLKLGRMLFREYYIESRLHSTFLISGKLVRFSFFLIFIIALLTKTENLAGFGLYQTILFFMTFNLIDITSQFLFRGAYSIQWNINKGQFDLSLTQPINVLFRMAFDIIDLLDLATLLPVLAVLGFVIARLSSQVTFSGFLLYLLLCLNALLIAMAIHIFIISFSILTQEISSEIWIYRDLMNMGRFPIDIYSKSVQMVLTFLLPIAVMVTFPTKVLLGVLSWQWIMLSFFIGAILHEQKSFGYAIEGIVYSFKKGTHFKIHVIVAVIAIILGIIYSISTFEWLTIILISSAVIAAETINTAIEETCDVLHPEHHPGARLAKHCAAGGVLILSIAAVIIGLIIFLPKIFG